MENKNANDKLARELFLLKKFRAGGFGGMEISEIIELIREKTSDFYPERDLIMYFLKEIQALKNEVALLENRPGSGLDAGKA